MSTAHAIDLRSSIVSGSDLRILLGSDHLSYGEIHGALKEKGIFVGESDKSITVPLLSATLLTPDNFTRLIENSVSRESQPKVKVAGLDLVAKEVDWITPLKKRLFDESFDMLGDASNVDFVTSPALVVSNANKITIPYQIQRQDFSKDWIQRELSFDAQVGTSNNPRFSVNPTRNDDRDRIWFNSFGNSPPSSAVPSRFCLESPRAAAIRPISGVRRP